MKMNLKWLDRKYLDETTDGDDGAGFTDATADNLMDLTGEDEGLLTSIPTDTPAAPSATPVAAPVEPVAPATPAAPVAPTTPAAPTAPAAPIVEPQPGAPAVQPTAPVAAPAEPVVPVTPAAPVEPVRPVETTEQVTARLAEERTRLIGELEKMYAIPEAEVDELRVAPETYLPKVAARLHAEVLTAVANGIYAQLPSLIRNIRQMETQQTTHEDKFFGRWGKLNTPELRPKVLEMVKTYRQLNPNASFETLMEEVGPIAHVRLRIPFEDVQQQPPGGQASTPAVPGQRPFVPGGAGGSTSPTTPASQNQFTQLANEFLSEPGGW